MTTMTTFKENQTVRFTRGPLGTTASLSSGRFEGPDVQEGDIGVYVGPHPNPELDRWHVVEVTVKEGNVRASYLCPVGEDQIEAV